MKDLPPIAPLFTALSVSPPLLFAIMYGFCMIFVRIFVFWDWMSFILSTLSVCYLFVFAFVFCCSYLGSPVSCFGDPFFQYSPARLSRLLFIASSFFITLSFLCNLASLPSVGPLRPLSPLSSHVQELPVGHFQVGLETYLYLQAISTLSYVSHSIVSHVTNQTT